jgi:hypothetical protein
MLSGLENLWSISMTKYVGSTKDLIDWDSVIASIIPKSGDYNSVTSVVDRSESNWSDVPDLLGSYHEIIYTWQKANYDLTNIEWWDYYPGQHFDIDIQNKFADLWCVLVCSQSLAHPFVRWVCAHNLLVDIS